MVPQYQSANATCYFVRKKGILQMNEAELDKIKWRTAHRLQQQWLRGSRLHRSDGLRQGLN